MGFGFNDTDTDTGDGKPKELEHKLSDVLSYRSWSNLKVGMRVQSILTGSTGSIVELEETLNTIHIAWDNGKVSRASRLDMNKVIIHENKE